MFEDQAGSSRTAMLHPDAVQVSILGPRCVPSPLRLSNVEGDGLGNYVPDECRVRYQWEVGPRATDQSEVLFEKAGPRETIFFAPPRSKAAIVTCGGLCPGLNNVIRSVYLELHYNYGVREVLGIRYGFQGLNPQSGLTPLRLSPAVVGDIHNEGGTILGSSRGPQPPDLMVDFLQQNEVNLLFCVGGDGTQRGARTIHEAARHRGYPLAVVGIPKTIDNDIPYVSRTFGFATAMEKAKEVITAAHNEAKGGPNGIGLVKLMGRDAGYIAAGAALASQDANFVLIPEVPFPLDGQDGLLETLRRRLAERGHAVIVVAEGAGQHLLNCEGVEIDASGNRKHADIGLFLRDRIGAFFSQAGVPVTLKYLDPSYLIRGVAANCTDALLCDALARNAVHAAMAGKSDVLIGLWHDIFIHVPLALAVASKKHLSPEGDIWTAVLASTGQPRGCG